MEVRNAAVTNGVHRTEAMRRGTITCAAGFSEAKRRRALDVTFCKNCVTGAPYA